MLIAEINSKNIGVDPQNPGHFNPGMDPSSPTNNFNYDPIEGIFPDPISGW
jgi:hypothetical protein